MTSPQKNRWRRALRRLAPAVAALAVAVPVWSPASSVAGAATAARAPLRLLVEPGAGIRPIDALLAHARHSVDLVIYELDDVRTESLLAADAARGVRVRVLLDETYEGSRNAAAYAYLARHRVEVRWAHDAGIYLTHEKAAVVDGKTAIVMTLNLVTNYYTTTRDFAVLDTQHRDVAAIEAVFAADWDRRAIRPASGVDLVWSPGAETPLVRLIEGARHSLLIENEEMSDPYITAPLESAARRGVRVEVVMTASSSWAPAFDALVRAGVRVRTYGTSAPLYIHAKAIVADARRAGARVFV
ncbi:MAG: phospholipase D-like domain-containing protein, partial [Acidimicrobiales bacterium]